jgi:hypothetical protein
MHTGVRKKEGVVQGWKARGISERKINIQLFRQPGQEHNLLLEAILFFLLNYGVVY